MPGKKEQYYRMRTKFTFLIKTGKKKYTKTFKIKFNTFYKDCTNELKITSMSWQVSFN